MNIKANSTNKNSTIQVHLPREVTIKDNSISLGQVSITRGMESLVTKANKIALGQITVPGQKIVIDKTMVLSRLACNGIPASKVTLTGAEKITVQKQERTVSSSEFVKIASSFLEKNPPSDSVNTFNPIRTPKDLVIPGEGKDIKFSPRLVQSKATDKGVVEIDVLRVGEKIGSRRVIFGLKHTCRQAVAKMNIPVGEVISTENIKIVKTTSKYPEPAGWKPPYGLITKRQIPENTILRSQMLRPVKAPTIVKRNQKVIIRIDRPGFVITATGKAMQNGKTGEFIKVRNEDSQRIILVRINENGIMEPVF
jgi:flagella basal body P-ring formation protein FlgA